MDSSSLKTYLDEIVTRYETEAFISDDPVSIPHGFDDPQDQEIIGLFAAILAWGRRDVMIAKLEDLCERMRYRPRRFVADFNDNRDAERLHTFGHRTFIPGDAINLVVALQKTLSEWGSLEALCTSSLKPDQDHIGPAIEALSSALLTGPAAVPARMRKHLARPSMGSACKRLCMYFRWMIRDGPVDLGIWHSIDKKQLILPLDVHSGRQARNIGLLHRKSNDWKAALELTIACRQLDREDPTRYDFAFFGTGVAGEMLEPVDCK